MNEQTVELLKGNGYDPTAYDAWVKTCPVPELRTAYQEVTDRYLKQGTPEDWPVFTLADAYEPREPRPYIVHGLMKQPSLSIWYGAPGTLKTMLLLDMGAAVARGDMWLPPLPGKDSVGRLATKAPVLFVDFDNGAEGMHERVEAIGKAHGLTEDDPFYYVTMPTPWLDASDAAGASFSQLRATIEATGARLVIIDNLAVVSGDTDENSADMTTVLSNFRKLSEDTGAAVVLIHHQRKATGFTARAGDRLRGHSGIEGAVDLAILIERNKDDEHITLRATKTRRVTVLPFGATFTYEHKDDCEDLERAFFFGVLPDDATSDVAIERAIIELLKDSGPTNKGKLKSAVKGLLVKPGLNRIGTIIGELVRTGQLTQDAGRDSAKMLSLAHTEQL